MENQCFSLLTASYNNGAYLSDWLKSIIAQKYRPLEVVFVNDLSNDSTSDFISNIASPQLREHGINLVNIQNSDRLYYGSSLKLAWKNASGAFFGTLDSDDALMPEAVLRIMDAYKRYPQVGYIYTQFTICDIKLHPIKKGFSAYPSKYNSMLDMGLARKHGHSHWRTFSLRVPHLETIFKDGLRCAVDKFYAYRLEELATGMFIDESMYRYRWGDTRAISQTEKPREVWRDISAEAVARRKKYGLKPYPILKEKT